MAPLTSVPRPLRQRAAPLAPTLADLIVAYLRAVPGQQTCDLCDAITELRPGTSRHHVGTALFKLRALGVVVREGRHARFGRHYLAGGPRAPEPCAWCSAPATTTVRDAVDGAIEPACDACACPTRVHATATGASP